MDQALFWQFIADTRNESNGDDTRHLALLKERLSTLPEAEIEAFERIYRAYFRRSHRLDLRQELAGRAKNLSNEDFDDFIEWLISQGEETFRETLEHPRLARGLVSPWLSWQPQRLLHSIISQAYKMKTGHYFPESAHSSLESDYPLKGYDWLQADEAWSDE